MQSCILPASCLWLVVLASACGSTASSPNGGGGAAGAATGGTGTGGFGTGGAGGTSTGGAATGGAGTAGAGGLTGAPITFGVCDPFTPCGGALEGTWEYTGACVDSSQAEAAIAGFCATATTEIRGVINGTLSFIGGAVARSGSYAAVLDAHIPASCLTTIGGNCALLQAALVSQQLNASCGNSAAGGCDCTITQTGGSIAAQAYTVTGNTITLADGRTFDYCISGGNLIYVETTANAEPGAFTLTAQ